MRGQSRLWHYNKPRFSPPPLQLPYYGLCESKTGEHRFSNPTRHQLTRAAKFTGAGGGGAQRKACGPGSGFVCLCALTSYLRWWTKRTEALWVVNKGFELDASAGAAASDVQPAIRGRAPCALSHLHPCCISVRHSSSHLEGSQTYELEA